MRQANSKNRFNVRVFACARPHDWESEMVAIGAEWEGVQRMAPKAQHFVIKVHGLRTPAVLILKEEMLAKGGDAAIHRDVITHKVERSDVLLMGTEKAITRVLEGLRAQPFELPAIADEIQAAMENTMRGFPLTPADSGLTTRLRPFYAALRERTVIMGILNVTPDSFSDGGIDASADAAVERALAMIADGADVIDIGGESSRPGAESVSAVDEMARVIPVIAALAGRSDTPISVDTCKPEVARAALDAGADIINDITGLASQEMRELAAERKAPSIIMHMKGTPQTMQTEAEYADLIPEIMAYFRDRIALAVEAGLASEYIILDPGIGFAKTAEHNMEIIRKLADFKAIGLPILIGTSRKAFIGKALGGVPADQRLFGTAATVALSIQNGANIIRVHDVAEMAQVARMTDAVVRDE